LTTGTASVAELREAGFAPDYIYEPELAGNHRNARHLLGTEIEIVRERAHSPQVRHAIFDHDGTISVLRQGWEKIMEPMMLKAILGDRATMVSENFYNKVREDARNFIDKTTGIQTLAQMKGLISLCGNTVACPSLRFLTSTVTRRSTTKRSLI